MSEHYADCSKCAAKNVSPSWARNTCGTVSCPFKTPTTAPDQPKAPPKQRVSGLYLSRSVEEAEAFEKDGFSITGEMMFALDLRDAQSALAAKDARIAELEESYERLGMAHALLTGMLAAARARADRLEAQLQAARAAGTREEGLIPAVPTDEMLRAGYDVLSRIYPPKDNGGQAIGQYIVWEAMYAEAIRARLTAPAEPTADTGEKG